MYNQSIMKSKMGSPRKQKKNAQFYISKADDIELNQNMALAVQQKLKRKKTLEHGLEAQMMKATAGKKNTLGTFKMPSRAHQAFDSFYQSTMPVSHTPSPEKTRPSLLDASRNRSSANILTLHSTLLGKKAAEDQKRDPFATGIIGMHRLLA